MESGTGSPKPLQNVTAETPFFEALTAPRLARFLSVGYCDSGVIKCTHHIRSLDDKPEYLALSYHWGSSHESRSVKLNGCNFGVTDSLYGALRRLKPYLSGGKLLWVDALCIDQQHNAEKSQQILLMRDIYTKASLVVGWLGEPDRFNDESRDVLLKLDTAMSQYWLSWISKDWKGADRLKSALDTIFGLDSRIAAQTDTGDQSCFERTLEIYVKPPWWCRTWIVQESVLPHTFLFLYGSYAFSIEEMNHAWQAMLIMQESSPRIGSNPTKSLRTQSLFLIRDRRISGLEQDLLQIILLTRSFTATDPRDQVYGVLGLTADDFAIVPDYTRTTKEVLMDTALRIMRHSGKLDALSILYHRSRHPHIPLSPWVSDLRASKDITALDSILLFSEKEKFFASGQTNCNVEMQDCAIKLEAFVLDEIVHLRTTPEHYLAEHGTMDNRAVEEDWLSDPEARLRGLLQAFDRRAFSSGFPMRMLNIRGETVTYSFEEGTKYPTGEDIDVACIYTMTFDDVPKHLMPLRRKCFEAESKHYQMLLKCLRLCRNIEPEFKFVQIRVIANMFNSTLVPCDNLTRQYRQSWQPGSTTAREAWGNVVEGITKKGYFVMAPLEAEVGDKVILCKGGRFPYLMRETAKGNILKGACFIHGIMYGEAWDADRCEDMWFVGSF